MVEIKDFNVLIDNKPFIDQPVKRKQEACKRLVATPRNDDYIIGNLLHYFYHQNYYKLIDINLSRQTNATIPQQIICTGKLEEDDGAMFFIMMMIFIAEKQQKTILKFSLDSLNLIEYTCSNSPVLRGQLPSSWSFLKSPVLK